MYNRPRDHDRQHSTHHKKRKTAESNEYNLHQSDKGRPGLNKDHDFNVPSPAKKAKKGAHDFIEANTPIKKAADPVRPVRAFRAPARGEAHRTVVLRTNPVPQFQGHYSNNYSLLHAHVKSGEYNNFRSLGRISYDKKYYFAESSQCIRMANNFLASFWSSKDNQMATKENHWEKFNKIDARQSLFPSCISFVSAEINGKKHCIVTVSGLAMSTSKVIDQLTNFINDYNLSPFNREGIEFSLINGDTRNFSRLVKGLLVNDDSESAGLKNCSEKYYASVLTKLYAEHGSDLYVSGVTNYDFYPYFIDTIYGNQADSVDASVTPPYVSNRDNYDILDSGLLLTRKPCCKDCQTNKNAILRVFKAAQTNGRDLLNERQVITSPLRNSFATQTSLLSSPSIYAEEDSGAHIGGNERRVELERDKPRQIKANV